MANLPNLDSGTPLMDFQLTTASIKDKSNKAWGESIAKGIETTINGGYSGYYFSRNARFRQNRMAANGRIDMVKFKDFLDFNGKTNFANLNWQSIRIVNRIISGLVGRWMNRLEKIEVSATDALSVKEKKDEYDNIEFIVYNRKQLEELQKESGVQMIPEGDLPADKDELTLWAKKIQRLPEEIIYEMGINDVLASNDMFSVIKKRLLHDSAEVGFVGTKSWMDEDGVIYSKWVKPENALYSYSEYDDMRDNTWRGEIVSIKVKDLRRLYGKEFHPNDPLALTEEELFEIASQGKNYQLSDKITWNINYNVAYMRPYDEYNVDAIEFEWKTVDSEAYTVVTTKKNKATIIKKGRSEKKADNEEVKEDSRINIYEGVYLRYQNKLLKWNLKKNMIRPQDPKEIGNAEFSYSFFMYQNWEMRNIAVPEKIEEPADQMILARLKIQQLVATMIPAGSATNIDALQEIDLGLASGVSTPTELERIYRQTGRLYYRGRDAEGNQIPVPIIELQNSGFIGQMQGLIELYRFHYQVLKDELGEDPALMTQAATPRVTEGNVNTAQELADNNTDYMYDAYKFVIEDTAKKVACLLKDSVEYGSDAYRSIVKEDNVKGRIFSTSFKLLPNAEQLAKFEAMLNNITTNNPDFILFANPFHLVELAKQDIKLAWVLFERGQKRMLLDRQQTAAQNQQATGDIQIKSAQAAEQAKQQTEQMKGDIELQKVKMEGETSNKSTTIQMVSAILSKGGDIPPAYKPFVDAVLQNVMLPLMIENQQIQQQVAQQMQQAQQQSPEEEQQEQGMQQNQQEEIQEQPQIEQQSPVMAA